MNPRPALLIGALALALGAGCDDADEAPATDAGPDIHDVAPIDGAPPADGGPVADAVPGEDAAPVLDAGLDADAAVEPGEISTAAVLCGFEGEGMQRLVYEHVNPRRGTSTPVDEALPFDFAWACTATARVLSGNGVPNHPVAGGEFATRVSAQEISATVTLTPVVTGANTPVREPGFALNGVKFEPATAGTCPDDAADDSDCDYAMGRDSWHMIATPGDVSPWRFSFGVDENDAHVQPNGQYHYHGDPVGLVEMLNPDAETSMTLVGWAADGFPMYSLFGHADPDDLGSAVAKMRSSFQTVGAPGAGRPSVEDFPLGHFEEDWRYVEGSGDLDECNGRFAVTPEFPDGIYHYHITETYPTVTRCVKGTAMGGRRPPRP